MCRCREVRGSPTNPNRNPACLLTISTGVPVATVGINNSVNAALLAARILGSSDPAVQRKVEAYAENARTENMNQKGVKMRELGWEKYFEQM